VKPDQSIYIQLVQTQEQPLRLGGVLISIEFFTKGNLRYTFNAGRTDEMGTLKLTYLCFERLRCDNAKFFLMDYNTKLEECDSVVRITIATDSQLRSQFENATKAFNKSPEWANVWPSNAQIESMPRNVELIGPITEVTVTCKRKGGG
jgi:hypothetical protein